MSDTGPSKEDLLANLPDDVNSNELSRKEIEKYGYVLCKLPKLS